MTFLERLARALNMDEISQEVGVELHTESLLHRAEQLARLESDKLVDKVMTCFFYLVDVFLSSLCYCSAALLWIWNFAAFT